MTFDISRLFGSVNCPILVRCTCNQPRDAAFPRLCTTIYMYDFPVNQTCTKTLKLIAESMFSCFMLTKMPLQITLSFDVKLSD